jgi:restriction endonuclease S subunit
MPAFRGQISTGTSTINQITGKMLNDIVIPVPDMETVERFKTFVEQSDKSKFEAKQALEYITAAQKTLMRQQLDTD